MVKWGAIIALVGMASYLGLVEFVQRSVHHQVQQKLNEFLPEPIQAKIGKASFIEGVGFKIDKLNLGTESAKPILDIDSAFIKIPVSTPELVTGKATPTAVKIKHAKLRVERFPDGRWNFEPLIQCFQKPAKPIDCGMIPIDLIDCRLTLVDGVEQREFEVNQINLHIREQRMKDRKLIRILGSLTGVSVEEVGFQVFLDPVSKDWSARWNAKEFQLSHNLIRLLPQSLKQEVDSTEVLAGTLNLSAQAQGDFSSLPKVQLEGHLENFTLKHPELPATLSQTQVKFKIDNDGLSVSEAKGLLDSGSFQLTYQQAGLIQQQNWSLNGYIQGFDFRQKYLPLLPVSFQNFCRDFSPAGVSDIRFELAHDGQRLTHVVDVDIQDLAFSFIDMPYLMEHCKGKVRWINEQLNFRLTTNDRGQEIVMSGSVLRPGKKATFKIDVDLSGSLPIDEKLLRSIRKMPKLQAAVHDFRPSGRITGNAVITKTQPDQKPQREFKIRLIQCNVRHKTFEYPIYNINGWVHFRAGITYFQQITGDSGLARVEANGTFSESQGIRVNFLCNQVPLNEQLRLAIPSNIRDIWNGFRPEGVVSILRVQLTKPPQKPVAVTVDADLGNKNSADSLLVSNVAIHPKWFPYRIRNLTGSAYVGNGEIRLSQMKGKHDRTYMIWNGSGSYSPRSWSLLLQKMHVGSVKVNEELLAALPKSLAPAIRQLQYQGALSVNGDIHLDGKVIGKAPSEIGLISYDSVYDPNSSTPRSLNRETRNGETRSSDTSEQNWNTSLAWDLRFDMDQAKMLLGLPVENVFGSINLQGRYDGRKAVCRGQLAVDSLTLYDTQINEISGPIWIDEQQILAGNYVSTEQSDRPPTPLSGKLFDGTLRLDAKKILNQSGDYFVQASLAQGKLEDAVKELAPQLEQVRGNAFSAIRFQGNNLGPRSYQGKGTLQLRNAEIYQLPVMIALLKIPHFKNLNRTAFDASNIDFKIASDRFVLDRIELIGDAISLIGNGQVNFNKELDLNFYTVMGRGRFYIPILSELYRAGSKRVLWINVDGSMQSPNASRKILPQLNDTIRQLFEKPIEPARSSDNQRSDLDLEFNVQ